MHQHNTRTRFDHFSHVTVTVHICRYTCVCVHNMVTRNSTEAMVVIRPNMTVPARAGPRLRDAPRVRAFNWFTACTRHLDVSSSNSSAAASEHRSTAVHLSIWATSSFSDRLYARVQYITRSRRRHRRL